jgi:hypothetical protein
MGSSLGDSGAVAAAYVTNVELNKMEVAMILVRECFNCNWERNILVCSFH